MTFTNDERIGFVDTNVLVHAFSEEQTSKGNIARELIRFLTAQDCLRTSTQVMNEFYVTMTRKIDRKVPPQKVLAVMDGLSKWPVIQTDYGMVREACMLSQQSGISMWDALVVVAAHRSGAAVLYTEDLNSGQRILGVNLVNPFLLPAV
jgi:predicted nucleic acid-binding protein